MALTETEINNFFASLAAANIQLILIVLGGALVIGSMIYNMTSNNTKLSTIGMIVGWAIVLFGGFYPLIIAVIN